MAVAEKTSVESPQRTAHQHLLISCSLGALYVIASFELVFMGLPLLWRALDLGPTLNEFLADSLLVLVEIPLIFGLFVLGKRLEGNHPPRGLRAGVAYICLAVLVGGLLATAPDAALWNAIGLALLAGAVALLFQPGFTAWLAHAEEMGWFHATTFKPNQGRHVRLATVVAIIVLAGCGVYVLMRHGTLQTGTYLIERPLFAGNPLAATDPWFVSLPFSNTKFVFLFWMSLNVPILLFVGACWLAWRVVNWPTFADFLIATEAEMNKVSWTTRKRLYQDTIVVLVTVVLFTLFLFVVDVVWVKVLTWRFVDVLKYDPSAAAQKNQQGAQW